MNFYNKHLISLRSGYPKSYTAQIIPSKMIFQFYHIPFVCLCFMATTLAAPHPPSTAAITANPEEKIPQRIPNVLDVAIEDPDVLTEEPQKHDRIARSPAKQNLPDLGSSKKDDSKKNWKVKPNVGRDDKGNTSGKVRVENQGDNHKLHADYQKTFSGPGKKSETWNVGGEFEW